MRQVRDDAMDRMGKQLRKGTQQPDIGPSRRRAFCRKTPYAGKRRLRSVEGIVRRSIKIGLIHRHGRVVPARTMLDLSSISLLCLDTRNPELAVKVMQRCMTSTRFHEAVLLTQADFRCDDPRITIHAGRR